MNDRADSLVDAIEADLAKNYRPICPSAVIAMILGVSSLVMAMAVFDMDLVVYSAVPALGIVAGMRALGSIARYDLGGRRLAWAGLSASSLALVGGLSAAGYRHATEVPPGYERLGYERLQPGPGEVVPPSAEEVDGEQVFIKGYMYPTAQLDGITEFVLCRDNGSCCFGGQPKLADMIQVTLPAERAVSYRRGLVSVAGRFRVEPDQAPGQLGSILYHLDADLAR
ncbi:hypothetical protein [Tautonia sociabilis]|uniref:DUF4190 domain-containing protein n=1 Tax=Tautonia sociabilis TaxID=2080755 RepID=A0A432MDI4_9BACT|nr:hypothetical protein [Tautonia sociabilis]RUL82795.1 hypothetical protein TsocGM_23130 [Tautonia sociabilis]